MNLANDDVPTNMQNTSYDDSGSQMREIKIMDSHEQSGLRSTQRQMPHETIEGYDISPVFKHQVKEA